MNLGSGGYCHYMTLFSLFDSWESGYRNIITESGRKVQINTCYLKEAHAILEGKHWEGKNRCVHLEGDP